MCVIVDANTMGEFTKESTPSAIMILEWIKRQGRIVYSDDLAKEYARNFEFLRLVLDFERAGKANRIDVLGHDLGDDEDLCRSNDKHIVVLARVSRASVLFSYDQDLHADYKNNALVGRHDRIVFQGVKHRADLNRRRCP